MRIENKVGGGGGGSGGDKTFKQFKSSIIYKCII